MKKLFIISGIVLSLMTAIIPSASAYMGLDPELRPGYAPVVNLGTKDKPADAWEYGNYFLQLVAGGLLYFAAPVAILMIAIAGFRYVTAHGQQESLEGAKKTLEWAIIGLLIVILSFAAVRIVITTLLKTQTNAPGQTVTMPDDTKEQKDAAIKEANKRLGNDTDTEPPPPSSGGTPAKINEPGQKGSAANMDN